MLIIARERSDRSNLTTLRTFKNDEIAALPLVARNDEQVSGTSKNDDGTTTLENGRLALFRNFDDTTGNPLPRQN